MSTRSRPASPSVTCYFVEGKKKSRKLAEAFATGAGGAWTSTRREIADGPAAFYGVHAQTRALWRQAQRRQAAAPGDPACAWYFIDNGYLGRGEYYRVTRNALQHAGTGAGDPARLARFDLRIASWRASGRHVLLCPPGSEFMDNHGLDARAWCREAERTLALLTRRPVRVRHKPQRDAPQPPLLDDLEDAWAVVTFLSNVAVEAVLAGVPVFVDRRSAAAVMGRTTLAAIEHPARPDGRERWAAVLAANQWTRSEIARGVAWRDLQRQG